MTAMKATDPWVPTYTDAEALRRRSAKAGEAELALDEPRVLNFIQVRNAELREAWRRKWRQL